MAHSFSLSIPSVWRPGSRVVALLEYHVVNIVQLCTEEQMIRIAARWIVTTMKNLNAFGYRAMQGLPDSAVSHRGLAVDGSFPVSCLVAECLPLPTRVWSAAADMRPQAGQDILRFLIDAVMVSGKAVVGDVRDDAKAAIGSYIGGRWQSAATCTKWYCIRGVARGIMFHVRSLLNRFLAAHLDAYNIAGAFSRPHYSTEFAIGQGA
jgi:hypothetical protein